MNIKYNLIGLSIILLLLYFQTFSWLLEEWLYNPFYSHGFLVPLISLAIIWSKRNELKNLSVRKEPVGTYLFVSGLIIYAAGVLGKSFFLSAISIIPVLIGLILYYCGKDFVRKLLFPVCFLIFMIPLPWLDIGSVYLQQFTANNAAGISQTLGADVYKSELELHVGDCPIIIGIPCSGMRSIISLLAIAAVFVYLIKGSIQRRVIVLFAAVPIAIASNTIRVTAAVLIADFYGCDAATTFFHDFSSMFLFIIAIILLIIFSKILKCDML